MDYKRKLQSERNEIKNTFKCRSQKGRPNEYPVAKGLDWSRVLTNI
jgi:hypothetical protein